MASSESSSSRKQDLSTTTEKGGLDVVAADSRAFSVKVEEGTEPGSEETGYKFASLRVSDTCVFKYFCWFSIETDFFICFGVRLA